MDTTAHEINAEKSLQTPPILFTETGEEYQIPECGSLGILALGYTGVMLWRQQRRQLTHTGRTETNSDPELKKP